MAKKTKIILAMDKGCIEIIDKPKDIEIEIRDYDDTDKEDVKKDDQGRKYYSYVI